MTSFDLHNAKLVEVFKLFLLPVGGGIPAGVLLARDSGVAWPLTAVTYLVSDLVLALAFEPVLRLFALIFGRFRPLSRLAAAFKAANARSTTQLAGTSTGPLALILVSFGVDPMTGRSTALAAGHGFLAGWAFAIAGDLLYFAVIALTTLKLNRYVKDPATTVGLVLAAMLLIPMLVRRLRRPAGSPPFSP